MTPEPILSRDAEKDLRLIARQRRKRGDDVANYIINGLLRHLQRQAALPDTGDPCSEYYPGLRRTTRFRYVMYFRTLADTILVVRIIHGTRNLDRILKRYFGS